MKIKLLVWGAVFSALTLLGGTASADSVAGALAGTTSQSCDEAGTQVELAVEGNHAAPGVWLFQVAAAEPGMGCLPLPAISLPFGGEWSSDGGCVPVLVGQELFGQLQLCLTNPVVDGVTVTYDFNVCDSEGCGESVTKLTVLLVEV